MPIAQPAALIANSNTTVLTVTSGQNWEVCSLIFCNTSASTAETLTVYLVPNGSSAATTTTIIKSLSVPATRTLEWAYDMPLLLDAGDKIIAIGATGSLVCASANYRPIGNAA